MKQFTLSLDLVQSLSFSCSLFLLVHYLPHVIRSRYKFSNLMNKLNRNTQRKKHLLRITHTQSLSHSLSLSCSNGRNLICFVFDMKQHNVYLIRKKNAIFSLVSFNLFLLFFLIQTTWKFCSQQLWNFCFVLFISKKHLSIFLFTSFSKEHFENKIKNNYKRKQKSNICKGRKKNRRIKWM